MHIASAFSLPVFNHYGLPLNIARFPQASVESTCHGPVAVRPPEVEESDCRQFRLLGTRHKWPRRRTAKQSSSARASTIAGMSSPSALAVLRLRTRSYFVGACTGM